MRSKEFHDELVKKMDELAHIVYKLTRLFPKEELFGVVSQIRRAALSVVLNYVEGFARRRPTVVLNFFEISYGSLKETKYLLYFSHKEGYIEEKEYSGALKIADEIGAMLWNRIKDFKEKC